MLVSNKLVSYETYKARKISFGKKVDVFTRSSGDELYNSNFKINKVDTIGWAFDGGGARGIFEIGVACALAKAGLIPDVVVGTSVGSINAVAVAKGDINHAIDAWKSIKKDNVYKSRNINLFLKSCKKFLNLVGMAESPTIKSIFDNSPLREFIKKVVKPSKLLASKYEPPIEVLIGATNVNTGEEGLFATKKLFENYNNIYDEKKGPKIRQLTKDNFEDAIVASTSIPMAFAPVQIENDIYMDGTGNCTPAKNGVNALFAVNKDMKEGLLFVVLTSPKEPPKEEFINMNSASLGNIGLKTITIGLDNISELDIRVAQEITREIERWGSVNLQFNRAIDKFTCTTNCIREKIEEILRAINLLPEGIQAKQVKQIAQELSLLGDVSIENTDTLAEIVKKYQPFKNKKKVKIIVIRPEKSFGINTLDFDKIKTHGNKAIRAGYFAALNVLYRENIISKEKYDLLMQERPYPVERLFDEDGRKLSKVV
ncbi:MAG: patatin-like phospholipase family protein [Cyanobacteriota bacterium]